MPDTPVLDASTRALLAAKLQNATLAITPRGLGAMLAVMNGTRAAVTTTPAHFAVQDRIALIPVAGPIFKRADPMLEFFFGATSLEQIAANVQAALHDPNVDALFFQVDSPGGEVAGLADFGDELFAARGKKPMVAVSDESMFSAAYWIGSAADQVVLPRTAGVGSVGVLAVHVDESKWLDRVGFTVTVVKSGEKKDQFSPFKPLSEEARAELQAEVDRLARMFEAAVGRHRGLDPAAVRAFEAGTFQGEAAVTAGLADRVSTASAAFDTLRARFASTHPRTSAGQGGRMPEKEERPPAEVLDLDKARTEAGAKAVKEERARTSTIRALVGSSRLPKDKADALATKLIDEGTPLEDVHTTLVNAVAALAGPEISGQHAATAGGKPEVNTQLIGLCRDLNKQSLARTGVGRGA